ncbi:MAG: tetratricopeptide repeat protein, partial [Lysobacterales bacterium]
MPASDPKPDSEAVRATYERAVSALKSGDVDRAESICRKALPRFRNDPNILCLLGEISLRQRRPQEAQTLYGKVLKRVEGYPRALEGMGLALLADGRPKEAVDFLTRAAEAAPQRSAT